MRRFVASALSSILVLQVVPLAAAPAGRVRSQTSAQLANGAIVGTSQTATGQVLPNYAVQVRNLRTGQVVATTTSSANGSFTFPGLPAGDYVVELVDSSGTVAGSSASIAVGAETAPPMTVSLSNTARAVAATSRAVSTALIVASVAVAAGIAGVVVAREDASPSN